MANRNVILLQCPECKNRNYSRTRKKKPGGAGPKKLTTRKYCPKCRTHTKHKEVKS
jgi:large subunit ribosomal protein L33